jgi:ATP-binding cassette subfamily B protein
MSDVDAGQAVADGRPGAGAPLVASLAEAPQKRPRSRDIRNLGHLLPFVRAHWGYAAAAFGFLLISTSASLGLTGALRYVIDDGLATGSLARINRTFEMLAAVALILALATALRFFFITRLGERVVADLRQKLYGHVLSLDQPFFLKTVTGEVLSRMTADMTIVEGVVGSQVSIALRQVLSLVGGLTYMFVVNPKLAGFIVLAVPVILAPMFLIGRRVRSLSVNAQDRFADAIGYAGESIDALETVQAFGRERAATERFGGAVEIAFAASQRRLRVRAMMTGVVMLLAFSGVGAVLWLGAQDVLAHRLTWGLLVQFAALAVMAAGSVGTLGEIWGDVQKASGAMQRISELLSARPGIAPPANPVTMPFPPRGEIEFEHVTFAYPGRPDLPALRGFDLKVKAGETVALVGPSGAGKSTVFRLLLRFYDPDQGQVRIDTVNLTDADPTEVRARIAMVAQDTPLFSGSATDNIRFGREDATDAEIRAAAKAAEAEAFINALPQGFDSPVGERAKTLSGGQRQRLAIARALVREAPILLLDEATSALDAENERLVQKALAKAMKGRTTLVIAHRLATVLKADRIVVMDEGRVVEQGTHRQLVAAGGLYAKLAELQFGAGADAA